LCVGTSLFGTSTLAVDLEVGLVGSAEPLDVPFDVSLDGSADSLKEVLDEGNIGSAELL
jgi:hypothetical protein